MLLLYYYYYYYKSPRHKGFPAQLFTITQRQTTESIASHKKENRARSDRKDRQNIREKLEMSIDPLDLTDYPDEIVNIVSGRKAPSAFTVDNAVEMGKVQM